MFKPNSPGCGCYLTATRYPGSACLIKLQWCTQGENPILDLGSGPYSSPMYVAKSGYLVTSNKGPFTLSSDGCKGPISCTQAAVARCPCVDPVPGSGGSFDAAGFRKVAIVQSMNPSDVTCNASYSAGFGISGSSVGFLSVHITTNRLDLDYAINDLCQGGPSGAFEVYMGSAVESQSFSGTITISGVTTAFAGTRTTTYDVGFGWNGTAWYWRQYNNSVVTTGTDARSAGFPSGPPLNFDSNTSVSCLSGGYGVGAGSFFFFFMDAYSGVTPNDNPSFRVSSRECIIC